MAMATMEREHVLIQGNRHSFHAQAAQRMGIDLASCRPMDTHAQLYAALRRQEAASAVVAIVNSTIGRVKGSYEELLRGGSLVTKRVDLPIVLGLYGISGARKKDIRVIHTQSHAYKQCAGTLAEQLPDAVWQEEEDTAGSALIVRDLKDKAHAAICPQGAGKAAGLICLRAAMQDNKDNVTTFYMLDHREDATVPEDANRAVAALDMQGLGSYQTVEKQLEQEMGLPMVPLHETEASAASLIVELPTMNHPEVMHRAQQVLDGLCSLRYLGGYVAA